MPGKNQGVERTKELEEWEERHLKPYALRSSRRRTELGDRFREYPHDPLEYRTEYHRDRDRIVWSRTFKRLQHKTQVFPHYVSDHYRRRLTHTLEVAQIATTLARALYLNETATEAIALGHDLGHTPFGHAGEEALNAILQEHLQKGLNSPNKSDRINESDLEKLPLPVFNFDHCVHGVETVSRIEREYKSKSTGHIGLNLSFDVRDGILKHMFERDNVPPALEMDFLTV